MIVQKKLNNNFVLALDYDGTVKIAAGKGIGYSCKPNEIIPEELIEKLYTLNDENILNQMSRIISDLRIEDIRLGEEIMRMTKKEFDIAFSDLFLFSLLDHIRFVVQRLKDGLILDSPIHWEIRNYYKKEYSAGLQVIALVNEYFSVALPDSEAVFIALHFINARFDKESLSQTIEFTELVSKIMKLIKYHFDMNISEESYLYTRFLTHLRYYLLRMQSGEHIFVKDDDVVYMILDKFKKELDCVNKIATLIYNHFGVQTPDQEKMYLVLHVRCLTQR